ncbi:hypothetical protein OUZ56_005422 [Daphnia magna]|uniref:Uncharacterized protein n=1 Tax=Daphnia magna TaxID=35525 RepID=A0ABQ9YSR8_9CRUS|nr:hypothetical protein OUZ56_005422 [Daphnia magna]
MPRKTPVIMWSIVLLPERKPACVVCRRQEDGDDDRFFPLCGSGAICEEDELRACFRVVVSEVWKRMGLISMHRGLSWLCLPLGQYADIMSTGPCSECGMEDGLMYQYGYSAARSVNTNFVNNIIVLRYSPSELGFEMSPKSKKIDRSYQFPRSLQDRILEPPTQGPWDDNLH